MNEYVTRILIEVPTLILFFKVPERAVHARGAGAHGTFTSYGDWSNLTAASFLSAEGKQTPMFTRFSTVTGSRGSADTARDVHGFATRFYTDEGNFGTADLFLTKGHN